MSKEFRILSPTAILGYGFPESSFQAGLARDPHIIAVDAGSTDPGPYYLGAGKSFTNRAFVKRDLKYMIKAGLERRIPVIIGTAGGSGAKPHVDWCQSIIEEIAEEESLVFRLGIIYSDIQKEVVQQALQDNKIESLACVPQLTQKDIEDSTYIVAQMGIEPVQKALNQQCEVILCGRCYDPAVFAALPVMQGFDKGLAYHLGKIVECAAIAATPGSGSDSVLGILTEDSFILEPLSNVRKFTKESTAAHTLYEKSDPYHLPGPGGEINLENCTFTEIGDGRVEVKGSQFIETPQYMVKLEGAKKSGYRTICIAGTRDPIMIEQIDSILSTIKSNIAELCQKENIHGEIFFHLYGKNGVMGVMEPKKQTDCHEVAILMEALGKTETEAETLCSITRSTLLHYGYENRISTAGNLAFPFSPSDINMGEMFEFSIYHLMPIENQDLFPVLIKEIGE
ncbi:MAG: DUF1446 domain-containing protein [Spirochaetes bacterium]|nr:DUF1446 domain-containing protein [Spirochaetota bacterium]